jgi:GrpB-like predicted nucleotidyltransferase (UPF0157 family)
VSIPIDAFDSRFSIGPLTGPDARVRVQIMHLPAGGVIGRHETALDQLVACVAGSGAACGGDRAWRELRPGYAARWEAGEDHETRSDGGMTLVCVEGTFDAWALAVTQEIEVVDHDPDWQRWFEEICAVVWPAVQDVAVRIDHVGSTSVPGLAAKPIIDMDIVVASEADVRPAIERLGAAGWWWRGDLGVTGRQAFRPGPRRSDLPRHHLYLVVEDTKAHLDHWLLRDLLRSDADARHRYAELKRANVELAGGDMDVYVAAKAELVAELLARARAERGLPPATYWDPGRA